MNGFDFCSGLIIFLIIGCGICGNVLSFMVWTKGRRCKKLPGGIYLRALAVSDTIALCIPALNEAISLVSPLNPMQENDFLCKLEIVGHHFGLMVSSWIIVSFTIERTVAIFRPTATTNLFRKKGTIALMVIIFVVNFFINFPYGIAYEIKQVAVTKPPGPNISHIMDLNQSEGLGSEFESHTSMPLELETLIAGYKKKCSADPSSILHYANWYHIWFMDVFLIFIIPFTLITGSNLMVVYLVVSRNKSMVSKLDSKVKAVTMRAVIISVMHCVTSGAFSMSILFPEFLSKAHNVKYSNEYYGRQITLILTYVNHAMNFILYSLFGSEFRRDCNDLILKKSSAVHPETSAQRQTRCGGDGKSAMRDPSLGKTGEEDKTGKTNISAISM